MKRKILATFCALVFSSMLAGCGTEMGNDISSDMSSIIDSTITDSSNQNSNTTSDAKITKDKAKEIALKHASVSEADITDYEIELDNDDNILHYDISFKHNGKKYDYDINAQTGEVMNDEKNAKISKEKAKEIALKHAGVKEADISDYEIDLDTENGVLVYDISFDHDGKEYDYDVNATTGEISNSKNELID